jgi:hypothetical protein
VARRDGATIYLEHGRPTGPPDHVTG